MLGARSSSIEMIDDMSITDERIDDALQELKVINRFLGGSQVLVGDPSLLLPVVSEIERAPRNRHCRKH